MTDGMSTPTSALGQCLSRIETLIEALNSVDNHDCHSIARELVDSLLTLHGIALAKAITICQNSENGELLMRNLLDEEYFAAVILLHGLHPEEPEARLQRKVAELRAHWGVQGVRVDLIDVDQTTARIRVSISGEQTHEARAGLIAEIEQALTEAAPDLDRIIIEDFNLYSSLAQRNLTPSASSAVEVSQHGRQSA